MQFLEGCIHFFLIEFSLFGQPDIASYFFEQFDTAQRIFQIVDGAAQRRL